MKFSRVFGFVLAAFTLLTVSFSANSGWTSKELATLQSLWLDSLPEKPSDPSNAYADNPKAAELGQKFFFDTRFSKDGTVSCATCHMPQNGFVDNLPQAKGIGTTTRKTMNIVGAAYGKWFFWDGRADALWNQALGPLESAVEHGGTRTQYAKTIAKVYRSSYESVFGQIPNQDFWNDIPDRAGPTGNANQQRAWQNMNPQQQETVNRIFANLGKAIAAYEMNLKPGRSRFDQYVGELVNTSADGSTAASNSSQTLSEQEIAGLRLFIGKANCIECHNTPRFTDDSFYNVGAPDLANIAFDNGRQNVYRTAILAEFGCRSTYSDNTDRCPSVQNTAETPAFLGAFKTPSLRNVAEHGPYTHAGQLASLEDVVMHYSKAPSANVGENVIKPLNLTPTEQSQLVAFLESLTAPINAPASMLISPIMP